MGKLTRYGDLVFRLRAARKSAKAKGDTRRTAEIDQIGERMVGAMDRLIAARFELHETLKVFLGRVVAESEDTEALLREIAQRIGPDDMREASGADADAISDALERIGRIQGRVSYELKTHEDAMADVEKYLRENE